MGKNKRKNPEPLPIGTHVEFTSIVFADYRGEDAGKNKVVFERTVNTIPMCIGLPPRRGVITGGKMFREGRLVPQGHEEGLSGFVTLDGHQFSPKGHEGVFAYEVRTGYINSPVYVLPKDIMVRDCGMDIPFLYKTKRR